MNKEKILTILLNMIKMKVLFILLITIMSMSLYGQEKNGRFSQNTVDYSNLSDSSFLSHISGTQKRKKHLEFFKTVL